MHPALRRTLAEELVRLRRSDEPRRLTASQRGARIDANPHQIDAVAFALSRLREGGCILADEVGLGKTIEAGLVIAQRFAEGARRVLLIAPKSLLGQWRQELFQLFEIEAREGSARPGAFDGEGVFLINREAAGTEKGHAALLACEPFDLCVIDEAHEVFAGLYKRYTQAGGVNAASTHARTAARVKDALGETPVLLLTATPIQNNLGELWGLVQYVDPLGTLLGDLPTFRDVFCGSDDRQLAPGVEDELRGRLKQVLQRTLRRQAQPFLEKPFVDRQARLFEYTMNERERALYDDVTAYLLDARTTAFQGRHRQLLLLGFHRRMASSTAALQSSLERIEERLARGDQKSKELAKVRDFIARARELGAADGKFQSFIRALGFVSTRAKAGQGSDKLVLFTESRVTQQWLREQLISTGVARDDEMTLLSGTNDSPRAREAFERWKHEVPHDGELRMNETSIRLALVHEFKTRSRLFISTEAGAKGLNLQFCNTVVNYDLPWNPQRIEQRIGRCHRYGQTHDVTVINFLAKDNETQALTFDILSRKLELFGTVLDASDQVLHKASSVRGELLVSALGAEFEAELARIYDRARTVEEVHEELRALRDRVGEERARFEETHARTASVLAETLDDDLLRVFKKRQDETGPALAAFDAALLEVVVSQLGPVVSRHDSRGQWVTVDGVEHGPLHLQHPLVVEAVRSAREAVMVGGIVSGFGELKGQRGTLSVVKIGIDGFEKVERLVTVVTMDDGTELETEQSLHVLRTLRATSNTPLPDPLPKGEGILSSGVFLAQQEMDDAEDVRFKAATEQAERYVADRRLVLMKRRARLDERFELASRKRESATGSEARGEADALISSVQAEIDQVDEAIGALERRDDPRFQKHHAHIVARRYTPPRVETLFALTVDFA